GDFLAIIGPNGSGKTTLIKIMLGLIKPQKGRIRLFGKSLGRFSDWGKIGYVPQKATHFDSFFPISVKEVVSLGLTASGRAMSKKRKADVLVREALARVEMEEFLTHRIGTLSSGQQQRVFIARAIVSHPSILILDEPTTGVDSGMQERFFSILGKLHREENMTIVMITHEIGILDKHFNRVACLNQKLIYHGRHDEFCRSDEFKKMIADGKHVISHIH
ncbi:MAG: ABC transporter ATP-binding protein, partial [Candidatus Aminicenantes bacterium]|nr:ABC transporter ATP-binding protein [Candidatus Aminicenantes bacterium]